MISYNVSRVLEELLGPLGLAVNQDMEEGKLNKVVKSHGSLEDVIFVYMNPLWHTHIVSGKEWLIDPFADWLYPALQRNHDNGKRHILKWFRIEPHFLWWIHLVWFCSDEGSRPMSTIWRTPHRRWYGWSGNLILQIPNMSPAFSNPVVYFFSQFYKSIMAPVENAAKE